MISVIIPTCNRNDLLRKCLDKLDSCVQALPQVEYEVIVSDDSKQNAAKDFIKTNYKWTIWVEGPKKGPAANRNNGAKHANGEWLIFIDDDCLPDLNLLNAYKDAIVNNPEILAFEGAILPDNCILLKKDMAECPVNTSGGCFWSANICVQKKLFERIGGFNEQFFIAAQEDQQLKIDIESSQNKQIVFVKNAFVIHPVRFTSLRNKIFQIPAASKNFCLYAVNNKKLLGYTSVPSFSKRQIVFHLKNVFAQLRKFKPGKFLLATGWLFYGVPLNILNFYRLNKKRFSSGNE